METVPNPTPVLSDAELIAGYVESMRWGNLSVNTRTIRESYLRHLSRDLGPFGEIKGPVLQLWLGNEERDLSPSTISLYLTTYSGFFDRRRMLSAHRPSELQQPISFEGTGAPMSIFIAVGSMAYFLSMIGFGATLYRVSKDRGTWERWLAPSVLLVALIWPIAVVLFGCIFVGYLGCRLIGAMGDRACEAEPRHER